MRQIQRLFLLTAISLPFLFPLSASADPRAVVHRAECARGDVEFIINSDTDVTIASNRVVQARVPAGSLDNTAGIRLNMAALVKRAGVEFEKFEVKADVDEADVNRCFLQLVFDLPGNAPDQVVTRSFSQLSSRGNGEFRTFIALNNQGFSTNGVLKDAAILVRAEPSTGGLTQTLRIGKLTILHRNERNAKTELYLQGTQSSCGLLSAP